MSLMPFITEMVIVSIELRYISSVWHCPEGCCVVACAAPFILIITDVCDFYSTIIMDIWLLILAAYSRVCNSKIDFLKEVQQMALH